MRILVVGMANSVHLARWLKQFVGSNHEFRIVPSTPQRRLHPDIEDLVNRGNDQFGMGFAGRWLSWPIGLIDRFASHRFRGALVAWEKFRFKPDIIHVLEFQNAGYSYLRATSISPSVTNVPLLLTPYGSDIYWYQQFPKHLEKIQKLLGIAKGLSAECVRDERLARAFGFKGVFGPTIPAFGSISFAPRRSINPVRSKIAIKGYQNHWGQALNAFKALEEVVELLQGIEIVVFSCEPLTEMAALRFQQDYGIDVNVFRPGLLSHEGVQELLGDSIALIALSKSDGISASMIEAMANGAVPIQSRTSCCDEWLDDGVGGFLVDYDNIKEISQKIRFILESPGFRESAAIHNFDYLSRRMSPVASRAAALATYEIFGLQ